MTSRTLRLVRIGLAAALAGGLLTACGGGDGDTSARTDPASDGAGNTSRTVPSSAGASSASFISFLRNLATNDTDEPLSLNGFVAPVDDTSDSTPLS